MEKKEKIEIELLELDKHESKVYELIITEVVRLARYVLQQNKSTKEFCMAMGMFSISHNKKSYMYDYTEDYEFAKLKGGSDLYNFICEHTDRFKITGDPMRFTATSEITTDW